MFVNILYFKRVIYIFVFDKGRKIRVTNTDTVTSLSNRFSCIYIILTERYLCLEARACRRGVMRTQKMLIMTFLVTAWDHEDPNVLTLLHWLVLYYVH